MKKLTAFLVFVFVSAIALAATYTDPFTGTSATLGADWTACATDQHALVSDAAATENTANSSCDLYTANALTADQCAKVIIQGKAAGSYFTVLLRGSGSGGTKNTYQTTIGGPDEYYISEVVSGSTVGGTEVSGTTTFADGDELMGCVEDTTVSLYVEGALVDTATFSSHSSGAPGIESYWGTIGTRPTFLSFEASDIEEGGGGESSVPAIFRHLRQMKQ